jgi:hypothetical protein
VPAPGQGEGALATRGALAKTAFATVRGAASGYRRGAAVPDGAAWPIAASELTFVTLATWTPDPVLRAACRDFSNLALFEPPIAAREVEEAARPA